MTNVEQPSAAQRPTLPFRVQIEPWLNVPRWLPATVSVGAVILGLILGAIALRLAGEVHPFRAYASIAQVLFGSWGGLSDVLVQATPLILVGLACSVAFSMKLWNIGAEGQFFIGAFAASAIVLTPVLPAETPGWIFIPVMMVAGLIGGALWGFLPGYLKARFNVNEIITTLMMNYIAIEWNNFFIFGVWSEGGFQMSPRFPQTAWLPRLADYAREIPAFGGLTLHLGLIFGPIAAVIVWFILYRSKWGYEIRLAGDNPKAARYAGINIARNTVLVMLLSGSLSGRSSSSSSLSFSARCFWPGAKSGAPISLCSFRGSSSLPSSPASSCCATGYGLSTHRRIDYELDDHSASWDRHRDRAPLCHHRRGIRRAFWNLESGAGRDDAHRRDVRL
jgi:ABC-type uncharacterized transport system permease subunit